MSILDEHPEVSRAKSAADIKFQDRMESLVKTHVGEAHGINGQDLLKQLNNLYGYKHSSTTVLRIAREKLQERGSIILASPAHGYFMSSGVAEALKYQMRMNAHSFSQIKSANRAVENSINSFGRQEEMV